MKNSWLIFAHVINSFEMSDFKRDMKKLQHNLSKDTDTYVLRIYKKKLAKIYHITDSGSKEIYSLRQGKLSKNKWLLHLIRYVKKYANHNDSKILGLTYYGHGGSFVLGPWDDPFITLRRFINIFVKTIKPQLICFDSCYMGAISCLYEIQRHCRFVIASPSWHPYKSLSTTKTFGKLPNANELGIDWKTYVAKLTCEFNDDPKNPKYSCLIGFDLLNLKTIMKKVKTITFNKNTELKQHDSKQHDLYLTLEMNPSIQQEIKDLVITPTCIDKCPNNIHGMSIREPDYKDPWHHFFIKTKWYKILRKLKIYH